MDSNDLEEERRKNEKRTSNQKQKNIVLVVILCVLVLIFVGIVSYGISYSRRFQEKKDREAFLAIATTTLPPTRAPRTPTAIPTTRPTPNPANVLTPEPTKKPKASSKPTQRPAAPPRPTAVPTQRPAAKPTRSPKPTLSPIPAGIYPEGQYKVGIDIPAGEYIVFASGDTSGYFAISSDANGKKIIQNDNFEYNSIITVEDGEYFKMSRAYAKKSSAVSNLDTSGEGMFKVGVHIPEGEYKLTATGDISGYYAIYDSSRQDKIIANDNFKGSAYVHVQYGQYLTLNRCKIIK